VTKKEQRVDEEPSVGVERRIVVEMAVMGVEAEGELPFSVFESFYILTRKS